MHAVTGHTPEVTYTISEILFWQVIRSASRYFQFRYFNLQAHNKRACLMPGVIIDLSSSDSESEEEIPVAVGVPVLVAVGVAAPAASIVELRTCVVEVGRPI